MGLVETAASGLQAALLLARGRAEGVGLVGEDQGSAARSFLAMGFCVPRSSRFGSWAGSPAVCLLVRPVCWDGIC